MPEAHTPFVMDLGGGQALLPEGRGTRLSLTLSLESAVRVHGSGRAVQTPG